MSFENIFGPDGLSLEKIRIIGLLEKNDKSLETMNAIQSWTEQMEARSLISSKEMIRFNVDRAELYEASGDIDGMFECLDQAMYQTEQEMNAGVEDGNWDDLYQKIKVLISEMEEKYPA